MPESPECADARALIPELATGTAAGDERARALAHLSRCPCCRLELAATVEVADELLLLTPRREPGPGFESAVLDRLTAAAAPPGGSARAGRRRRRVTAAYTAAAVAAAVLGAWAVWQATAPDRELAAQYRQTLDTAHGKGLRAARLLTGRGTETGTLFAYEGSPSWVYATFRPPPAPGTYEVMLTTEEGHSKKLRPLEAAPDTLAWGSTITVPVSEVESVQFIRGDTPFLTARFRD